MNITLKSDSQITSGGFKINFDIIDCVNDNYTLTQTCNTGSLQQPNGRFIQSKQFS